MQYHFSNNPEVVTVNQKPVASLSEFQGQYNTLHSQFQKLRTDYDNITLQKKKLQIKLMNLNPEHFEKERKRLQEEVEKYQLENEENKHKYFIAQNMKKQLQATNKVKIEELKQILKQLQKQRISSIQLKHQLAEREKLFGKITAELEKSNNSLSQNYDEMVKKHQKIEALLKAKGQQFQQSERRNKILQKQKDEAHQALKRGTESNEKEIKNRNKRIQDLEKELLENKMQNNRLQTEVQRVNYLFGKEKKALELLSIRKTENLNEIQKVRQTEISFSNLEKQNKQLKAVVKQQTENLQSLKHSIRLLKENKQVFELQNKIKFLEREKIEQTIKYERQVSALLKQKEKLKLQNAVSHTSQSKKVQFQDVLRMNIEEKARLKLELEIKIDEVSNLRSDIEIERSQRANILTQLELLKKKLKSSEKNNRIQADIAGQEAKNQLQSLKRKLQSLQMKLASKVKEVKEKDNFIISSIVGRSRQEDAPLIMGDIKKIFEANYIEKLEEAKKRIEELSK